MKSRPARVATWTSEKGSAYRVALFVIGGAAATLGMIARLLLLCGVIIWSIVRLPWICLVALFDIGMRVLDGTLTASQTLSHKAVARRIHR
jgi:hypothetical protein